MRTLWQYLKSAWRVCESAAHMGQQQKTEEVLQETPTIASFPLQIRKVFYLYGSMMFSRARAYKCCESS